MFQDMTSETITKEMFEGKAKDHLLPRIPESILMLTGKANKPLLLIIGDS